MKRRLTYLLMVLLLPLLSANAQSLNGKLWKAVDGGDGTAIQALKDEGANVNALRNGVSPLMFAVQSGQRELCEALLNAGADPNARGLKQMTLVAFVDNKARGVCRIAMGQQDIIEHIRRRQLAVHGHLKALNFA